MVNEKENKTIRKTITTDDIKHARETINIMVNNFVNLQPENSVIDNIAALELNKELNNFMDICYKRYDETLNKYQ